MPSWSLATALDMSRGTNTKLRTAEGHNQSSYKGMEAAAQMLAAGRVVVYKPHKPGDASVISWK
jgi:hypothetical protein